ncbi:MAG: exoribonuclease II [Buchnera aphidicola (Schlechtendalia chinensis)]
MFHNHPLLSKLKKKLHSKIPRIEGIIKSTRKGFGFLEINSHTSYFVPPQEMKLVMHGDRVIAQLKIENNREVVYPEKLIEPFLSNFIGKIQIIQENFYVKPDYPYYKELISCTVSCILPKDVKTGDWVLAVLTNHKLRGNFKFCAKLIKFIAKSNDPLVPWLATLEKHQLEISEPNSKVQNIVFNNDFPRTDCTNLNFITIDHHSTKDIDDALFIERDLSGNFVLTVAISDPTSYVDLGSKLDKIALNRAFTHYLPGFNVPMLPRILSENKCSLKINKRRPAIACKIFFNCDGTILHQKTNFFLTWVMSKSQLSYKSVSDWLENKGEWFPESDLVANQLLLLNELCHVRIQWRKKHALLFNERPEYVFKLSNSFEILDICSESKRIANKIVEESMIAANFCAAKFLSDKLGFGIYNIHSGFDFINAKRIVKLLSKYNISFDVNEIMTLNGFCKLKRLLDSVPNEYLRNRIQRFLSFGGIDNVPGPHFALGFPFYATWTSPIRKYGDMINHRLLKVIITGEGEALIPNNKVLMKINNRRRCMKMAERDVENWLYVIFLKSKNHSNKVFSAKIIDICRSGIKVKLLENGANVFLPSTLLHSDKSEILCNREKGIVYIMGKEYYVISSIIKVTLIDIKLDARSIIGKPVI